MANACFNLLRITGLKSKIDDFTNKVKANKTLFSSLIDEQKKRGIQLNSELLINDICIFNENSLQLTFESKRVPPIEELNLLAEIYPELEFRLISNLFTDPS